MPICISGMHRSGTSMVARLVNLCGVHLGEENEMMPPAPANPEGYWEHVEFVRINDELLKRLAAGWDVPPECEEGWERLPELADLRRRAGELVERFNTHPVWGWKDPRNAITLPFWQSVITDLKVIICVRNPLEVANSLSFRGSSSTIFGLNLWKAYNERLMAYTAPATRVVTHYDAYFYNPQEELRRVLALLNIPSSPETVNAACSAVSRSLRHSVLTARDVAANAPAPVLQLYLEMCAEAGPIYSGGSGEPAMIGISSAPRGMQGLEASRFDAGPATPGPRAATVPAQDETVSPVELQLRALLLDTHQQLGERDELLRQLEGTVRELRAELDQLRAQQNQAQGQAGTAYAEIQRMRATRVWQLGEVYWLVLARVKALLRPG